MLKEILFEIFTIFVVVGIPLGVYYFGFYGWCAMFVMGYLSVILDYHLFPHMKKNLITLKQHGYSEVKVWCTMLFNLLASNALAGIVYAYCVLDGPITIWVPIGVAVNMLVGELFFTSAHMWLHYSTTGSRLHLMHHCCKEASWSTNLIFHPIDLVVEFSGPASSAIVMHFLLWKDDWTLFITIIILHLWYALDHSALLNLPHIEHHTYCDTMFSIYVKKYLTLKRPELVKTLFNDEEESDDEDTPRERKHVIINNDTYDITDFMSQHPGGKQLMYVSHGDDITKGFMAVHKHQMEEVIKKSKIKKLT